MTTLKYTKPAPLGSTEGPTTVKTTVRAYDEEKLRSQVQGQAMGIFMMGVMHFYFGYNNPLIIQSILPIKNGFESNLAQVHVFGHKATGDLERPWKEGGFMQNLGGASKTDAVSAKGGEARGGVKQD